MGAPSPIDTRKFNVDEAHSKINDFSACGRLLRDSQGDLIHDFYYSLGRNNSRSVEMLSLVHVIACHLHRIIFETDYILVVVNVLNRSTTK
jgi:hypothetical protein